MIPDPDEQPRVYFSGDGERSTAGSNYGDWRPSQPQRPHGYDFEQRFKHQLQDLTTPEPDELLLREAHERELDALYPDWPEARRTRYPDEFLSWREEQSARQASDDPPAA